MGLLTGFFSLVAINDGKPGKPGKDAAEIDSISEMYAASDSNTTPPQAFSGDRPRLNRTNRFLWALTITILKDGRAIQTDPQVIEEFSPSVAYYPCGSYNQKSKYVRTDFSAPFVEYLGLYYALIDESADGCIGVNPRDDVANHGGHWEVFQMLEYVMTKVGFVDWGKLAAAVFQGDYMLSQYGVNSQGAAVTTADGYKDFNQEDPMNPANAFRPNILMDFLRGEVWLNKLHARGNVSLGALKRMMAENNRWSDVVISLDNFSGFLPDGKFMLPRLYDREITELYTVGNGPLSRSIKGDVELYFPEPNNYLCISGTMNSDTEKYGVSKIHFQHSGGFFLYELIGSIDSGGRNNWLIKAEGNYIPEIDCTLIPT